MIQRAHCLRLGPETREQFGVGAAGRNFQGHEPISARVTRAEHQAHTAAP
jgi:hypothetical protein